MPNIAGLNSKSFAKGSVFPAYKNDILRLYGMRYCPYNERAALVLCAKGLDKPEWFLQNINPLGKVPTIQFNDKIVYESLVVAEWLDEEFSGPKLLPKIPFEKAQQKMLIERCSKVQPSILGWLRDKSDRNLQEISLNVSLLESLLSENDYFSGRCVGFADYMVWPSIEWCELLPEVLEPSQNIYTKDQCPNLLNYAECMKLKPEIKMVYRTSKERLDFLKTSLAGNPDYDVGL